MNIFEKVITQYFWVIVFSMPIEVCIVFYTLPVKKRFEALFCVCRRLVTVSNSNDCNDMVAKNLQTGRHENDFKKTQASISSFSSFIL